MTQSEWVSLEVGDKCSYHLRPDEIREVMDISTDEKYVQRWKDHGHLGVARLVGFSMPDTLCFSWDCEPGNWNFISKGVFNDQIV